MNRSLPLTLAMAIVLPFAAVPAVVSAHAAAAPMSHGMAASPAPSKLAQTLRTLWLGLEDPDAFLAGLPRAPAPS